ANIINVPDLKYPTIQAGIDSSSHGDTVLVTSGTYYENINFNGKNIVLCSQFIFSNDTTDIAETVIDGNRAGCVVVFENGEDSTAVICGFTITNGYVRLENNRGGGITCLNMSSPILSSLHIRNNNIDGDPHDNGGAGIYCKSNSNPVMDNIKLFDNSAQGCDGGAILCRDSSSMVISNSIIRQNKSSWGTICLFDSNIEIDNVLIEKNSTWVTGAGLHLERSDAIVKNSQIINNHVSRRGGGIHSWDSSFILDNVLIENNSATDEDDEGEGGGLYMNSNSYGLIENSTISSNMSLQGGGGIFIIESQLDMNNVVIKNNISKWSGLGGGICALSSGAIVDMENVKIYRNRARRAGGGIYCAQLNEMSLANVTIAYNKVDEDIGGGIYFETPSSLIFSSENPSSIFLNKAPLGGADIAMKFDENMSTVLDSFTVSEPSDYHLYPRNNFNITIQNPLFESLDADLYVSPDGSDSNTGTSSSEPLKSVNAALAFASTDSSRQRYIHLASGSYSSISTGEDYPLYGRSYISVIGEETDLTILDADDEYQLIYMYNAKDFSLKNLTLENAHYDLGSGITSFNGQNNVFENLILRDSRGRSTGMSIALYGGPQNSYLIKNVLVNNNSLDSAAISGAAILLDAVNADLVNVTISDNKVYDSSTDFSGLLIKRRSNISIVNSIIFNNSNHAINCTDNYNIDSTSIVVAYSNIEGGLDGIIRDSLTTINWLDGNIDEDPLFVGGEPFDYHLRPGSPCINAGTAFLEFEGDTIVNLKPEEYEGSAPDIGAFGIDPVNSVNKETLIPLQFKLFQNYPNPFNNTTTISYQLVRPGNVNISIYDITGRLLDVLEDGKKFAYKQILTWDASRFASGIYFLKLSTNNHITVRKMLLVK
ncbi:MAG: T9SS type A sorting domain-containing protein, partial [ANME-2 cluster archaeon]